MEFLNSFFKSVNERLTSPLYWALLIATIIWNYDIFLTIFFVDNEAILKITKDEFIKSTYIHDVLFPTVFGRNLLECMHPLLAYISSFTWRIVPVFGLAWFFIEIVPIFASWAHGKEREFMFEREEWNMEYERKLTLKKAALLNAEKKQIDAEVWKVVSERKKRTAVKKLTNEINGDNNILPIKKSEQDIWDEEYIKFIELYPSVLNQFSQLAYKHKGDLYDYWRANWDTTNVIKAIDLYALGERDWNKIHNTTKGKYFLKKNEEIKK